MPKLMNSQKWYTINEYSLDYYELLYRYYAACAPSIPITYYSLDLVNSVYDGSLLQAGAYEPTGNLSGLKWKKITMVQVYNFEQIQFNLQADETGPNFRDRMSSLWFPTIYELEPKIHDFIAFEWIKSRNDQFKEHLPMYEIINLERANSAELTFWKAQLKSTFRTKGDVENHISGRYSFVDFEKHIYTHSDAIFLQTMMVRNSNLKLNDFYKNQIGLYVETKS